MDDTVYSLALLEDTPTWPVGHTNRAFVIVSLFVSKIESQFSVVVSHLLKYELKYRCAPPHLAIPR